MPAGCVRLGWCARDAGRWWRARRAAVVCHVMGWAAVQGAAAGQADGNRQVSPAWLCLQAW
jgi:hypothetical protein